MGNGVVRQLGAMVCLGDLNRERLLPVGSPSGPGLTLESHTSIQRLTGGRRPDPSARTTVFSSGSSGIDCRQPPFGCQLHATDRERRPTAVAWQVATNFLPQRAATNIHDICVRLVGAFYVRECSAPTAAHRRHDKPSAISPGGLAVAATAPGPHCHGLHIPVDPLSAALSVCDPQDAERSG